MSCRDYKTGSTEKEISGDMMIDYSIKRVITRGLAKGTHYKIFYKYQDGTWSFYSWFTRKAWSNYKRTGLFYP